MEHRWDQTLDSWEREGDLLLEHSRVRETKTPLQTEIEIQGILTNVKYGAALTRKNTLWSRMERALNNWLIYDSPLTRDDRTSLRDPAVMVDEAIPRVPVDYEDLNAPHSYGVGMSSSWLRECLSTVDACFDTSRTPVDLQLVIEGRGPP